MKPWIVVTGSSGLIGTEIIKRLSVMHEVAALDIAPPREEWTSSNVHCFPIDLGDPHAIRRFFEEHPRPVQGLINLAAYYNFLNQPSIHSERLKQGLFELARAFKVLRLPNACFVQASSMACLEPLKTGVLIQANAPSLPRWEYPRFKKESEDILRSELANVDYVEMVLAGVYTDFCELVPLYHFIECHLRHKLQRFFYPGNGKQGLTYIHINDVCEAFERQLHTRVQARRLLLGESEPTTYRDIATLVDKHMFGFAIPKIRVPQWFARLGAFLLSKTRKREFYQPWMIGFAQEHYHFDLEAMKRQLNWTPSYSLKKQLTTIMRNVQEKPGEWRRLNTMRPWHTDDWPQLEKIRTESFERKSNP